MNNKVQGKEHEWSLSRQAPFCTNRLALWRKRKVASVRATYDVMLATACTSSPGAEVVCGGRHDVERAHKGVGSPHLSGGKVALNIAGSEVT